MNVLGWVCGLGWCLCECVRVGLWLGVVLVRVWVDESVAWGGACVNVLGWVCGLGWCLCECVRVGLWLGVVLV